MQKRKEIASYILEWRKRITLTVGNRAPDSLNLVPGKSELLWRLVRRLMWVNDKR